MKPSGVLVHGTVYSLRQVLSDDSVGEILWRDHCSLVEHLHSTIKILWFYKNNFLI